MGKIRSLFYLLFTLILLVYGLPRFDIGEIEKMSHGFSLIWTAFAVLIIGAHLYELLGVKREREQSETAKLRQFQSR